MRVLVSDSPESMPSSDVSVESVALPKSLLIVALFGFWSPLETVPDCSLSGSPYGPYEVRFSRSFAYEPERRTSPTTEPLPSLSKRFATVGLPMVSWSSGAPSAP